MFDLLDVETSRLQVLQNRLHPASSRLPAKSEAVYPPFLPCDARVFASVGDPKYVEDFNFAHFRDTRTRTGKLFVTRNFPTSSLFKSAEFARLSSNPKTCSTEA